MGFRTGIDLYKAGQSRLRQGAGRRDHPETFDNIRIRKEKIGIIVYQHNNFDFVRLSQLYLVHILSLYVNIKDTVNQPGGWLDCY
jgi:hypothetical protein